jgi:hypothetical protein
LSKAQARTCQWASSKRRVVPGSAISPSQRGDIDVDAHQIARAFLDVSRRANVALDRARQGFRGVRQATKAGPVRRHLFVDHRPVSRGRS